MAVTALSGLGLAVIIIGWLWPPFMLFTLAVFLIAVLLFLVVLLIDLRTNLLLLSASNRSQLREELNNVFAQQEALLRLNELVAGKIDLPPSRHWAASPDFLVQLYKQIETNRPRTILELGSGLTTIVSAYALRNLDYGGTLHSVDHSAIYLETTRKELKRHRLDQFVSFHEAPLEPTEINGSMFTWYSKDFIEGIDSVDCLVVDGPPTRVGRHARYPALPLLKQILSPRALVLVDDAARDDEKSVIQSWMNEFPELQKYELVCEKGCVLLQKP